MEDAIKIYNENKLLMRAMERPLLSLNDGRKYYDCSVWADEFGLLMKDGIDSLSTTLVIPNVGVRNYGSIGVLFNSDFVEPIHISKTDSLSSGSIRHGDFEANGKGLETIEELANYIIEDNATEMNEVNINTKIDSVVGLYINKCQHSNFLLQTLYPVKLMLKHYTGIDYPIYLYDFLNGKLELIDLTKKEEQELIDSIDVQDIFYWLEDISEAVWLPIEAITNQK